MSLPGLDSGAVLVDHAWEAAAPWQVSCEEGEMVYRVGDDSEDGWVEVQRARDGTRGSVPASYLGREVVPEAAVVVGSPRSEAAVVVGSLRSPLPDAPDGWLVHSTDQGVLYYQNLVDGHVQWERPTRVASDLPPGAADAASAPVAPAKAAVATPVASPKAHSPTTPPRAAPPLPPRCSTSARPLPKPPAPPPRPVAVTPPPRQPAPARDFRAGGRLGASSPRHNSQAHRRKNGGSVQSAAGTGAKGLAACGKIAAGSLAHGLGYGFGRVLGQDAGGGASRSLGLKPRHF